LGRQPQRPGRRRAQQNGGEAKEQADGKERAEQQIRRKRRQTLRRQPQHRRARQRRQRHTQCAGSQYQVEFAAAGETVGQPAAKPGADGQAEQNQPDERRPDDLAVAKSRLQQARRTQLHAQGDQASRKDK
jgi:hypothetical protein